MVKEYLTADLSFLILFLVVRHLYMVISEIVTLFLYIISMAFLPEFFGELLSLAQSYVCAY